MCGIAGFVTGTQNPKKIYKIFKEMLALSVRRGFDATGLAATLPNGIISIAKGPFPATRFVDNLVYRGAMSRQPVVVIGHVRAATKGSPFNNKNNHPIKAGKIVGVHNGVIRNDDYLTKHYDLKRNALVDSEVIFALLNKLDILDRSGIERVLSLLDGYYALAFQNVKDPGRIWLVKGPGRPLVVGYDTRLQTAWFASEAEFIVNAYRNSHILREGLQIGEMQDGDVMSIEGIHLLNEQTGIPGVENIGPRNQTKYTSSATDSFGSLLA